MEGFDEKLEKLLSSPETMGRIAALAGELSGGAGEGAEAEPAGMPDISGLREAVSSASDDSRISVLKALRDRSDTEGARTAERAILAIRVAKTLKRVLPEVGLI